MDKQHDTTAPACEALAAWDKLFNEREALNNYLDCSNDAVYHEPEGKVPAETVRDLATAATLLEHVNILIDKANERQSRRPSNALDEKATRVAICDLAAFDQLVDDQANKSPQECAARLRQFNYDVSENLAASMDEDGFTVTKTWTPKGLRHFLAEREFMERLLSDDGGEA